MKKIMLLLAVVGAIVSLVFITSQGLIPTLRTEHHVVRDQSMRFFECIRYKEFDEAADFHNEEDRKSANISQMLENLFHIPPENMDIENIYVVSTDIDSSGILT